MTPCRTSTTRFTSSTILTTTSNLIFQTKKVRSTIFSPICKWARRTQLAISIKKNRLLSILLQTANHKHSSRICFQCLTIASHKKMDKDTISHHQNRPLQSATWSKRRWFKEANNTIFKVTNLKIWVNPGKSLKTEFFGWNFRWLNFQLRSRTCKCHSTHWQTTSMRLNCNLKTHKKKRRRLQSEKSLMKRKDWIWKSAR